MIFFWFVLYNRMYADQLESGVVEALVTLLWEQLHVQVDMLSKIEDRNHAQVLTATSPDSTDQLSPDHTPRQNTLEELPEAASNEKSEIEETKNKEEKENPKEVDVSPGLEESDGSLSGRESPAQEVAVDTNEKKEQDTPAEAGEESVEKKAKLQEASSKMKGIYFGEV